MPIPRPLPCGGSVVHVDEFRIRDLAEMQAVLDGLSPDPWEAIREEIAAGPAPQRRAELLSDAWEKAERGPAGVGTAEGNAYFSTTAGAAFILWAATRRGTPGMTPAVAVELFSLASPAEIGGIWRAAYGISASAAMERHVYCPELLGAAGEGPAISWTEAIDEVMRHTGWTYPQIYDMTISEFGYVRRRGKDREAGVVLGPGQDWGAIREAQRRWFYGETAE